jgi:hypothetical protein
MQFTPVQVASYREWGKLVLSWALGTENPPGDQFTDNSVTLYKLPAGIRQLGAPGIGVTFPETVTEVVFVRDTSTRRYVRLPDPDMAKAAQDAINNGADYVLPPFYAAAPLNCQKPTTAAEKLVLQAERVGDYSIGSCM